MQQQTAEEEAAKSAIDSWYDRYLSQIGGHGNVADKVDVRPSDIADHILEVFAYLDVAPCDGVVSIVEVQRTIQFPPLHFNGRDLAVLHLMVAFFESLKSLSPDKGKSAGGITRNDINILKKCVAMQNRYSSTP